MCTARYNYGQHTVTQSSSTFAAPPLSFTFFVGALACSIAGPLGGTHVVRRWCWMMISSLARRGVERREAAGWVVSVVLWVCHRGSGERGEGWGARRMSTGRASGWPSS